ncbi:GNAT family N-acetyltransferase [Curvibacter sp. APW13]|uniref:GNAT family N-acetyltransferase n=1 Tax=Curvibacter sp. APW13 TaxID=3077236 RepID=UPI0028E08285|nr:GNAT family N-acetyltransferase [Curvibacter sp. APW13]MDT8992369.1 GNAT family N-acetyltransferase [Curvibacter sp. APW13]
MLSFYSRKTKPLDAYKDKVCSAEQALAELHNGDHVFVGTGCAAPVGLVQALESLPSTPADLELVHFFTIQTFAHDAQGRSSTRFRHRSFFIGTDMRQAMKQGLVEYVPMPISRVPEMMALGRIPVDVALIQVSLPDAFGYVSLGISVDVMQTAVAQARLVIAEVNPAMPRTLGESTLHISRIHKLVPVDRPITEFAPPPSSEEAVQRIGRYIAGIIEDGSTLQVGMGQLGHEALQHLTDRKDLGIHSDVISDAIIPLLQNGCLTGARKTTQPFKIVTSMAVGTRELYDLVDHNPLFSFQPIDVVCDPATIAAQHKMVSIAQAFAIDLTGQVCVDQFEGEFYTGLGSQGDFFRGAALSRGGKPIICMTSTTPDGQTSRIRPALLAGEAATLARTDVHYVVTEYGIAYLFGKSIRQRATALIELAHPKFRPELFAQAQVLGYIGANQTLHNLRDYPVEDEQTVTLKDGRTVMLRPAKSSDALGIRELFHHLSEEDVYTRFFRSIRGLSDAEVERLCNVNYESEVAFVATTGEREAEQIVAQSCYFINPTSNLADTAYMVHPEWQGSGLGSALQACMVAHAKKRGLRGFEADILPSNARMLRLARSGSPHVQVSEDGHSVHVTVLFQNPA